MTLDEEYMRQVLCSLDTAAKHPVAASLLAGSVKKCFDRSPALMASFLETARHVIETNEQGIMFPTMTYQPDWSRVTRVLWKMGKGLFYFYMKRRLPADAVIDVVPRLSKTAFNEMVAFIKSTQCLPFQRIGNAIAFGGGRKSAEANDRVWLINFYETHSSVIWTRSRSTTSDAEPAVISSL